LAFVALLDANVLYPLYLRDIYLRLCQAGLFQVRWSEEILNEMSRHAKEQVGPDRAHQIDRTIAMMKHHFRDAMVTGYEHLIPSMTNNEKDQHVLAAAIVGRADVIVTNNVRHFPEASCAPYNIDVQRADQFLCYQWDVEDPDDVVAVLEHWAARLDSPPYTLPDLLEKVLSKQVPNFSQTVLDYLDAS
jgi:predicted nucleic acid-binding protein